MKYAFMREHIRQFSVAAMSRALKVSRSGFYDWLTRPPSQRRRADEKQMHEINGNKWGQTLTLPLKHLL